MDKKLSTLDISAELFLLRSRNLSRSPTILQSSSFIPPSSVEFIFSVCSFYNLGTQTRYLALELFLSQKAHKDMQLASLACIFLSSKLHDQSHIDTSKLLESCEYRYTHSELLKQEKAILQSCDYRIFLPTRYDLLLLYLERVTENMHKDLQIDMYYTSLAVLDMAYLSEKFIFEYDRDLLIAAVIQATFILLTQYLGNFPQTYLLKDLSQFHIQEICNTSHSILELVLGPELYFLYNFSV